jgi:predicted DNA-binding transcriptional regulator YafY
MGKLAAALPGESGKRAGRIRERLLVDSAGWGRRSIVSPHLRIVQDAVFADRRLHLTYRRAEAQIVERDVDPLGLIIKAGVWYLLADVDGARRLFRLSRIEAARARDEPARRPKRFDLARAWREQSAHWESGRAGYEVVLKVAKVDDLALVLRVAGDRVVGRPRGGLVRLAFPALEPAAAFISSFGARVEVVQPDEVRADLARRGAELLTLYGTKKGRPRKRPAVSKS